MQGKCGYQLWLVKKFKCCFQSKILLCFSVTKFVGIIPSAINYEANLHFGQLGMK